MGVSPLILSALLTYGLLMGLGVVAIRRSLLRRRNQPDETLDQRILDELDQLDVQVQIFNERLKRVEDVSLLGSSEDQGGRRLRRGE